MSAATERRRLVAEMLAKRLRAALREAAGYLNDHGKPVTASDCENAEQVIALCVAADAKARKKCK